MKLHNVLIVLATATATAALTLALLAPRGGDVQAGPAVPLVIPQPKLASQGCTFTLKTDKASYEAGESPVVEVTAVNPTDKPMSVSVWAAATERSPTSRMTRMLPFPIGLWSHEYAFTLPPHGKKSLTAPCAALPAGQDVTILLSDQQNAVMMGSIGIPSAVVQNGVTPNGGAPVKSVARNAVPQAAPQPK